MKLSNMWLSGILCLWCVLLTQANTHGQQPPHSEQAHIPRAHDHHGHRVDRGHVMEHLEGQIDTNKPVAQMTDQELQFHYFKLHDYDNNNKLDGTELISAMTDYHTDEAPSNQKVLSETEITNLIDTILKEDDKDGDGYIDYAEYILSTKK